MSCITLAIAKILSVKNARAWVSITDFSKDDWIERFIKQK